MSLLAPVEHPQPSPLQEPEGLTIRVSRGTGSGPTRLSAFDAALRSAGVADFNLIRLSSVIPPRSNVMCVEGPEQLRGLHGDRLYCVYAEAYASSALEEAWAGVAWSRRTDNSGDGLFVEHEGASQVTVEHELQQSLAALSRGRGGGFQAAGQLTASATCIDEPVCAIVIATYQSVSWDDRG